MTRFSPELIQMAKKAKNAEELLALAQEQGIPMTADEADAYIEQLHPKSGKLDDDDLDMVAGGGCGGGGSSSPSVSYPPLPVGGSMAVRPKRACPNCGSYAFVVYSDDGVSWRVGCLDCVPGEIYSESGSGSDAFWSKYDPA